MRAKMDITERFLRHVNKEKNCWLWTGQISRDGYGLFSPGSKGAHKVAWELFRGQIPDGMLVLHKCDIRNCVNPAHLFLGTYSDNAKDMMSKGRGNKARGERVSGCKLTEQKVLDIRAANEDWNTLAKRYGVSTWTIDNIKRGTTWKWVVDSANSSEGGSKNKSAGGTTLAV